MPINHDEYLRASNGLGESVRAHVVVERDIGSIEINVDTVLNWPAKFIATSGMLDDSTGTFDPETVTVFYGHINGTYIEIDEYAPGYEDLGNQVNEIIVIKPTTPWADTVAENLLTLVTDFEKMAFLAAHPVGSTYWNETESTNPSSIWGGTWTQLKGTVLGGISDVVGSPFNVAAGTIIGEDKHTLSVAEMPSHWHRVSSRVRNDGSQNGSAFSITRGTTVSGGAYYKLSESSPSTNSPIESDGNAVGALPVGGGESHNIIQRTAVGYLWKRTA